MSTIPANLLWAMGVLLDYGTLPGRRAEVGHIRDLVRMLDEEMDGVAREQRQKLESIEAGLEDVRRRMSRVWQVVENTDLDMAGASERIKEHRERRRLLEVDDDEARTMLAERRVRCWTS